MEKGSISSKLTAEEIKELAAMANMKPEALAEAAQPNVNVGSDEFTSIFVMGKTRTKNPIRRFRGARNVEE